MECEEDSASVFLALETIRRERELRNWKLPKRVNGFVIYDFLPANPILKD